MEQWMMKAALFRKASRCYACVWEMERKLVVLDSENLCFSPGSNNNSLLLTLHMTL